MFDPKEIAQAIKPFVISWFTGNNTSGASGYVFSPAQYPEALLRDGSRSLLGNLSVASNVTIDGVDIDVANASVLAWQSGHLAAADPHPQYALRSILISAGLGMTGGGSLAASRTLSVDTAYTFSWSARHTFAAGLTSNANINGTLSITPGRRDWATDGVGFGNAAIYNDGSTFNRLMIVGSDAAGGVRRIGLWDDVDIFRNVGSQSFASGFTGSGWRVDNGVTYPSQTTAEFDNLTIRGLMRVYELLVHKIRTGNGSYLFAPGGKVQSVTALGGSNYAIAFESDHGLAANDLIRAQKFDLSLGGVYQSNLTVTSITSTTVLNATLFSGVAPAAGYEYARIGNTSDANRRGGVYITSDDTNAPYIDVYDGVAAFADWGNPALLRARLGRLSGITDALFGTLSGYGIYTSTGYFTGGIRATSGRIDGVLDIGVNGGIWQGSSGTFAVPGTGMRILNSGGNGYLQFFNASVGSGLATTALGPNGVTFLAPSGYGVAGYPVVQFEAGFDGVVGTLSGAYSSNIRALQIQAGGGSFGASLLTLIANSNTAYAMLRLRGAQQTAHLMVNGGLYVGTTGNDGFTPQQRLHINGAVYVESGPIYTNVSWINQLWLSNAAAMTWGQSGDGLYAGFGSTSNAWYWITSPARDGSAAPTYPMNLTHAGNLSVLATIQTGGFGNVPWGLGSYTAGAPAATGYVSVWINGTVYRLLAST